MTRLRLLKKALLRHSTHINKAANTLKKVLGVQSPPAFKECCETTYEDMMDLQKSKANNDNDNKAIVDNILDPSKEQISNTISNDNISSCSSSNIDPVMTTSLRIHKDGSDTEAQGGVTTDATDFGGTSNTITPNPKDKASEIMFGITSNGFCYGNGYPSNIPGKAGPYRAIHEIAAITQREMTAKAIAENDPNYEGANTKVNDSVQDMLDSIPPYFSPKEIILKSNIQTILDSAIPLEGKQDIPGVEGVSINTLRTISSEVYNKDIITSTSSDRRRRQISRKHKEQRTIRILYLVVS